MALDGALCTDRPGFTDTTFALERGHVQFELGYTYSYDEERGHSSATHTAAIAGTRDRRWSRGRSSAVLESRVVT